jgi:hypothetical protein
MDVPLLKKGEKNETVEKGFRCGDKGSKAVAEENGKDGETA